MTTTKPHGPLRSRQRSAERRRSQSAWPPQLLCTIAGDRAIAYRPSAHHPSDDRLIGLAIRHTLPHPATPITNRQLELPEFVVMARLSADRGTTTDCGSGRGTGCRLSRLSSRSRRAVGIDCYCGNCCPANTATWQSDS